MEKIIIPLDHEFGGKVNLEKFNNIDEGDDTTLIPLSPKEKCDIVFKNIELFKQKFPNIQTEIKSGKFSNAFYAYTDNADIKQSEMFEKEFNLLIPKAINLFLKEQNKNPKDYYRSSEYFESQTNESQLIITWARRD